MGPRIFMLLLWPALALAGEGTFAGGCFWCVEHAFDEVNGVQSTTSGYAGGEGRHPRYEEVSQGITGHAEVVRVVFDETVVSYEELLKVFWRNVDPTTEDQQFCDFGSQYRTAIFYHDEGQKAAAEASKLKILEEGRVARVVTEIVPMGEFFPAEDYHQNYHQKNPVKYQTYRWLCGRDQRLEELWGEPDSP